VFKIVRKSAVSSNLKFQISWNQLFPRTLGTAYWGSQHITLGNRVAGGNELTNKFSRMQAGAFATGVPPTLDEWPRAWVIKENKNGWASRK
jgi:hypothetical protein